MHEPGAVEAYLFVIYPFFVPAAGSDDHDGEFMPAVAADSPDPVFVEAFHRAAVEVIGAQRQHQVFAGQGD